MSIPTRARAASLSCACALVAIALLLQACGNGGGGGGGGGGGDEKSSCPGSPCCSVTSVAELEDVCPGSPLLEVYGSAQVRVDNDGVDGEDPLGSVPADSGLVVTDETRQCGPPQARLEISVRRLEGAGSTSLSSSRFRAVHAFGTANVSVGALEAVGSSGTAIAGVRTWQQAVLSIGAVYTHLGGAQFVTYSNCASRLHVSELSITGSATVVATSAAQVSLGSVSLTSGGLTIPSASSWASISVLTLTGTLAISSVSSHGNVRIETASTGSLSVSSVSSSAIVEIGQLDNCGSLAVSSLSASGTLVVAGGNSPSAAVAVSSLSSQATANLKGVVASSADIQSISSDASLELTMSAGARLNVNLCSAGGHVDVNNQSEVSVISDGGCTSFSPNRLAASVVAL